MGKKMVRAMLRGCGGCVSMKSALKESKKSSRRKCEAYVSMFGMKSSIFCMYDVCDG